MAYRRSRKTKLRRDKREIRRAIGGDVNGKKNEVCAPVKLYLFFNQLDNSPEESFSSEEEGCAPGRNPVIETNKLKPIAHKKTNVQRHFNNATSIESWSARNIWNISQ